MTKDREVFSFEKIIKSLRKAIDKFPDKRRERNKQYKLQLVVPEKKDILKSIGEKREIL